MAILPESAGEPGARGQTVTRIAIIGNVGGGRARPENFFHSRTLAGLRAFYREAESFARAA